MSPYQGVLIESTRYLLFGDRQDPHTRNNRLEGGDGNVMNIARRIIFRDTPHSHVG